MLPRRVPLLHLLLLVHHLHPVRCGICRQGNDKRSYKCLAIRSYAHYICPCLCSEPMVVGYANNQNDQVVVPYAHIKMKENKENKAPKSFDYSSLCSCSSCCSWCCDCCDCCGCCACCGGLTGAIRNNSYLVMLFFVSFLVGTWMFIDSFFTWDKIRTGELPRPLLPQGPRTLPSRVIPPIKSIYVTQKSAPPIAPTVIDLRTMLHALFTKFSLLIALEVLVVVGAVYYYFRVKLPKEALKRAKKKMKGKGNLKGDAALKQRLKKKGTRASKPKSKTRWRV